MLYDIFLCTVKFSEEKLSCSAHLSLSKIQNSNHKVIVSIKYPGMYCIQHVTTSYWNELSVESKPSET